MDDGGPFGAVDDARPPDEGVRLRVPVAALRDRLEAPIVGAELRSDGVAVEHPVVRRGLLEGEHVKRLEGGLPAHEIEDVVEPPPQLDVP